MRRLLCLKIFLTMILVCAACTKAADVKFGWDYDPNAAQPDGFEMRVTTNGTTTVQECGKPADNTCIVPYLGPGEYTAACFAYRSGIPDVIKEYSDSSNIVTFTVPEKPAAPSNNRIAAVIKLTFNKEENKLYAQQWTGPAQAASSDIEH